MPHPNQTAAPPHPLPPPALQLLELVASLRSRTSLLLHQRLQQSRARSLDAVAMVDDGLSLYPWQVGAGSSQHCLGLVFSRINANLTAS